MTPCSAIPNVGNRVMTHAVTPRNRTEAAAGCEHGPDSRYVVCRQFARGAALLCLVLHVVLVVAKEKMRGVHTKRHIAFVEHINGIMNGPIRQHISDSVSQRVSIADLDLPIRADCGAGPHMAFGAFVGLLLHSQSEFRGVFRRVCFAPMTHIYLGG